uniref:Uncharacterized protein n=1 Tax=Meloidogyne floridensis TaxID=298350 RepID=A0A915P2Y8_9BILA
MVNAYKIDFDNSSTGHNCQFIPDEQTIVGNYLYVLDDYKAYVDQRMKEIFDEEYAQTILEDWIAPKGRRQRKSRGESSRQPQHPQKFTVYSSEDSGNHCEILNEF